MPTKRTKEEQAAYMREYRARQKATTSPHAPQRPATPPDIHAACDAQIAALKAEVAELRRGIYPAEGVVHQVPDRATDYAEPRGGGHIVPDALLKAQPELWFLRAPDDDCGNCGHPWHNVEDGCKAPDGSIGRQRPCGCKSYHAGPLF